MKCPICNKKVGLGKQVQEWDRDFGSDVDPEAIRDFPPFINIFCKDCDKPVYQVFIEYGGFELSKKTQETVMKKIKEFEKN